MKKFLFGTLFGGISAYAGVTYFRPDQQHTLNQSEYQTVNSYINHHHLEKLLKLSIMNGYMQLNKAFLDYGMKLKLDGFYFYNNYFQKEEMD